MKSNYLSEQPDFNYKIILVGDKRVGKTSITNKAVFDEFHQDEAVTKVVQISQKTVMIEGAVDKWVQLHIWDTLGQEKFMALAPLFFRRAVGAFLVFDLCSEESFDQLDKWHEQLLKNTDTKVIIMLLGNKKDLKQRKISYNRAMQYARKMNFGYCEVSAKTGYGV